MTPRWKHLGLAVSLAFVMAPDLAHAQWVPYPIGGGNGKVFSDFAGGAVVSGGVRYDATGHVLWSTQVIPFWGVLNACSDGVGGVIGVGATGGIGASILANRVNVSGVRAWFNDATLGTGPFYRGSPVPAIDGAGGMVVAWLDSRANGVFNDVYAQRVGPGGNVMWTANGVPVCVADSSQSEIAIVGDGAGGAFVVWRDFRLGTGSTGDLYGQHLNAAGVPQWGTNGKPICDAAGAQTSPVVATDGAGGVYVAWWDSRSGNFRIYLQRLDGGGNALFAANGMAVTTGPSDQLLPNLVADGANGVFVCWEDHRAGGLQGSDIYATRVSGTGTFLWPALTPVCTEAHFQSYPNMCTDGFGGVIIDWNDNRNAAGTMLFTQRFDAAGSALWTADGVQVNYLIVGGGLSVAPDGSGGAYYENRPVARVLADGTPAWVPNFEASNPTVADVANDEGGFVRLSFGAAVADLIGATPLPENYLVFRRVPGSSAQRGIVMPASTGSSPSLLEGLSPPAGAWDLVASYPAYGASTYSVLAPTHADSSGTGPASDDFCVMTQTATRGTNFYSAIVTGHSVDNLAPPPPLLLVGGRTGESSVLLAWQPSTAADVWHYSVYRGDAPGFPADAAHRIAVPTAANYADGAFVDGSYYKVTATDRHGNESPAATLAPGGITGVTPDVAPRESYAAVASANPFARRAVIEYGLARAGHVELSIYDVTGRKVATLVDGSQPEGVRRVAWEGVAGSRGGPGVYLARFEAPGVSRTLRLVRVE